MADLELDLLTRKVSRAGRVLDLTAREFELLEYLMRHANQVVTRAMLTEDVWGYNFDPSSNFVDVHVAHLRAKIEDGFNSKMLKTVRGRGYRLQGPEAGGAQPSA